MMPADSACGTSCGGVGHEPPLDRLGRRAVDVVAGEQVADDLARPRDLAAAVAGPARICQGEIELGKSAVQVRGQAQLVAALARPDRPTDIGSGVTELLGERA
jgi:hypothetical protein